MPTDWISIPRSLFHSSSRVSAIYRPNSLLLEVTKDILIPSADIWFTDVWNASRNSERYCSFTESISTLSAFFGMTSP